MFTKLLHLTKYNASKYENILDDPNSKLGVFLESVLFYLILLFCFLIAVESIWDNATKYFKLFFIFDFFISSVFAIEYIYRGIKAKQKCKFLINPMRIIDLLSFLPFFLWFIASGSYLKIFRILRYFRIFRLIKKIPLSAGFIYSLKYYLDEFKAISSLYFTILFLGSTFVYYAEKWVNPNSFNSIPETLWWGLVTMTTVWYGDITPITVMGRVIWSILVFIWPLMWAIIWAITVVVFMDTAKYIEKQNNHRHKLCHRCKSRNVKEANYCIKCGESFIGKH